MVGEADWVVVRVIDDTVVDDTDDEVVGGVFVSDAHEGTQITAVTARVVTTAVRVAVFDANESFGVIATSASDVLRDSDTPTWAIRCSEYCGTATAVMRSGRRATIPRRDSWSPVRGIVAPTPWNRAGSRRYPAMSVDHALEKCQGETLFIPAQAGPLYGPLRVRNRPSEQT